MAPEDEEPGHDRHERDGRDHRDQRDQRAAGTPRAVWGGRQPQAAEHRRGLVVRRRRAQASGLPRSWVGERLHTVR
jgi:hypothetical protein